MANIIVLFEVTPTKEGMQKKWTIILGISCVIVTIALSIIYIA